MNNKTIYTIAACWVTLFIFIILFGIYIKVENIEKQYNNSKDHKITELTNKVDSLIKQYEKYD